MPREKPRRTSSPVRYLGLVLLASSLAWHGQVSAETEEEAGLGESSHALFLNLGLQRNRDDALFAVVHGGPFLGGGYEVRLARESIIEFELAGSYASLKHPFETETDSFSLSMRVGASYLAPVRLRTGRLYVGTNLSLSNDLSYYPYWDEQHLFWATSVNAAAAVRYRISARHSLHQVALESPLLAIVSRPEVRRLTVADDINFFGILRHVFRDPSVGSVNRHMAVLVNYEVNFPTGRFHYGFHADFAYQRFNTSRSRPLHQLRFRAGAQWTF